MTQLGWIPTTDPRKMADNERYDMSRLRLGVPPMGSVEVTFPYNREWIDEQNQGNIGACVGYSCSWMKSYHDDELFNAYWLYKRAQAIDNDPGTKNDNDGAYLWAAGDVLRKEGHALYKTGVPDMEYKIMSYWWAKSVDEIRTAAAEGYPVVFGIPWFSEFNSPRTVNSEYWIGTRASWGSILGGHAIFGQSVSDSRKAVALLNTWGAGWANGGPVWISYASIQKLYSYRAECMVCLDYKPEPPPPPPPPEDTTLKVNELEIETPDGKIVHLKGVLERVK